MAAQRRAPRRNPLIPTAPEPDVNELPPSTVEAPICGQHWPDGWASLPTGADYASCEHGEWAMNGQAATFDVPLKVRDDAISRAMAGVALDGVTTDGVPVVIEVRDGQPALVRLADPYPPIKDAAGNVLVRFDLPSTAQSAPASPFAPRVVPDADVQELVDLDAGADVMFMPSGG